LDGVDVGRDLVFDLLDELLFRRLIRELACGDLLQISKEVAITYIRTTPEKLWQAPRSSERGRLLWPPPIVAATASATR
jgi:hypothetical protein